MGAERQQKVDEMHARAEKTGGKRRRKKKEKLRNFQYIVIDYRARQTFVAGKRPRKTAQQRCTNFQ